MLSNGPNNSNGSNGNGVMPGRLNVFQRTMLKWNDLHPYNAVHVARVPGVLNLERLKQVIARTLETQGVTGLHLDRSRGAYRYAGGAINCDIKQIQNGAVAGDSLAAEIALQLNTPFGANSPFDPCRFF